MAARAAVVWELVPARTDPVAVIVALHGNGPTPAHLFRPLWEELRSCATVLVRSSQVDAPHVAVWRDRDRTLADVCAVTAAVTAALGLVPVILAGLGAGGRIALDVALSGAVDAAGALAFAPQLDALVDRLERTGAAVPVPCWVYPGGPPAATASCIRFDRWCWTTGIDATMRRLPGLGHEYPHQFQTAVAPAVAAVLGVRATPRR